MPIVLTGDVRVYREMNKNFMYKKECVEKAKSNRGLYRHDEHTCTEYVT